MSFGTFSTFQSFEHNSNNVVNISPNAPTNVSATTLTASSVSVAFTPSTIGTGIITYTVISSGSSIGSGTSSPIIVTGLSSSTIYIISVTATNSAGTSFSPTIINPYFNIPVETANSYTYITDRTLITGWGFSSSVTYNTIISNGNNSFNGNTSTFPTGTTQALTIQFNSSGYSSTVTQSIIFKAGTYIVNFYARPRTDAAQYYNVGQQITCSLNGTSVTSALTSSSGWILYSLATTILTAGTYILSFTISGGSGDTSLSFTGIVVGSNITTISTTTFPLFLYKCNSGDIVNNYLANYASGTAVYDASVNLATISTTTKIGGTGSLNFSNSTNQSSLYNTILQWVRCPVLNTSIYPINTTGMTISMWINPSDVSTSRDWSAAFMLGSAQSDYIIIGIQNGKLYIGMTGGDYNYNTLTAGTWIHVAWTISSSGVHVLYQNNVSSTPGTNGKLLQATHSYSMTLGANISNPYFYFNGYVDDVRIYNSVLTASQVAVLYNNPT